MLTRVRASLKGRDRILHNDIWSGAGTDVAVDIAVNVLALVLGPIIIWYVWTRRGSIL